jgi:large subunit ribosomal protein L3
VMKIDTRYNLLYIKGAIPGPDDAAVRVTDALKKGWFRQTFPAGSQVPFPTFLGRVKSLPRELLPVAVKGAKDPMARARREVLK